MLKGFTRLIWQSWRVVQGPVWQSFVESAKNF
jgi:hypothetical protein